MKINWKARFKNKTFVISMTALIISFVYRILSMLDVVPQISQSEIMELVGFVINILAFMGVLVDPTTDGMSDSERAMTYCTECDVRNKEEVTENG